MRNVAPDAGGVRVGQVHLTGSFSTLVQYNSCMFVSHAGYYDKIKKKLSDGIFTWHFECLKWKKITF